MDEKLKKISFAVLIVLGVLIIATLIYATALKNMVDSKMEGLKQNDLAGAALRSNLNCDKCVGYCVGTDAVPGEYWWCRKDCTEMGNC